MQKWEYLYLDNFKGNQVRLYTNKSVEYFPTLPDTLGIYSREKGVLTIAWKDKSLSHDELMNMLLDYLGNLGWEMVGADNIVYFKRPKE
jgi:hypothetical protein